MTSLAPGMTRDRATQLFLRHIANDYLCRVARGPATEAEAADSLKMHASSGGYYGSDGWWSTLPAGGKGIAYGSGSLMDEPDGVITWMELARAARTDVEQMALAMEA